VPVGLYRAFAVCVTIIRMERARLVRIGGTLTWFAVAVPLIIQSSPSIARLGLWALSWLAFGIALQRKWLLVQVAAVVGMVLTMCDGFEGTLLVIVAMQLVMPRRRAFIWIGVQTLLLAIAIGIHWTPRSALLLTPPYLGFQLLAFLTIESIDRSSRMAERLRISRDLHDTIGHHLTALSLNLEAALQRTTGDAHEKIEVAQSLARSLLTDVREIVASMESEKGVDLAREIRMLAAEVPRPRIELQIADDVRVDHPERARTILRCTQEIITNAARHSGAEHLWIVIDVDDGAIRIRAHDDGRGSDAVAAGFGLRAMRSRVEDAGGELRIDSGAGRGFDVTALVPVKS
jgi:signal transduction histidine kinase